MRNKFLFPLLLACFVVPGLASAQLSVDLNLVGSSPLGEYDDGTDASDVFDSGGGLLAGVGFGLGGGLSVGGEIGVYSNGGELEDDFGFFDVDLTTVPIHAILAYHSGGGDGSIGFFGKGGLGLTRHSLSADDGGDDLSQTNFSFLLGGGVTYGLSDTWDVQLGLTYHQTQTGKDFEDQDIDEGPFCCGDNPKFLLLTVGARYHGVAE